MNLSINTPQEAIQHYESILEFLKDRPAMSRKTVLSALVVLCDKVDGAEQTVKSFRDLMLSDIQKVNDEYDEQKMNDKQLNAMMSMDEIMTRYNTLKNEVTPLFKLASLDKDQFQQVQLYVLLSCLLLIPPRRSLDYTEFKIRNPDEHSNYMVMEKKKPFFRFHVYKTASKYGTQTIAIPPTLAKIIRDWTHLNTHDYLLVNHHGNKHTSSSIVPLLHGFFGKSISTSMLRHIFLSELHKDTPSLKLMKNIASDMGHSVGVSLTYVKK